MSVNMLGVQEGEPVDKNDVDILIKSPNKPKKSSPSIKSFFLPKESPKTDDQPANKKDIKNFFIVQNKSPTTEKIDGVQLIQDSDSDENSTTITDKLAKGDADGVQKGADECQATGGEADAKKLDEGRNSSAKKPKPKWTLSWRVTNKSKKGKNEDSDAGDFVDLSNDDEGENVAKKPQDKKSNAEPNDNASCTEEKAEGMNRMKDSEKKEGKKKKRIKKRKVSNTSMENKNDELPETIATEGDNNQILSKEMMVDKEDTVELPDASEGKIESKSAIISSDSQPKIFKSAFDILMSPTKSHEVDESIKDIESVLIEDVPSPTHVTDKKNKDQVIIECSSKSPSLLSAGMGNAFDVLMTKKKPNENASNSKKSPQKSKPNSAKFKLNIRYAKPLEFKDVGDDDVVVHKAEKQACGESSSKKNNKVIPNEETGASKKHKEANEENKLQAKKKKNSQPPLDLDQSHASGSSKNTEQDIVGITYISEENVKVVEEPRKMTKVKKKKKRKTSEVKSESFPPIEVQEDSNSSVQEVTPSDVAVSTPKTGPRHSSSAIIISPGSDDFEVVPKRAGLRKRNPKNNASGNETERVVVEDKKKKKKERKEEKEEKDSRSPDVELVKNKRESIVVEDKKKKTEKKEEKQEKESGSPGIELVKTCKTAKQEKENKDTEPKKLASIFVKKPKTIEKKEQVTDVQTIPSNTAQPKDDGNSSKPLDDAKLKAANMAFNALFATCRTTKVAVPGVQLCQQAAPWPSVSHVTQDAEVFSEIRDSKIGKLPWKPELMEDISTLKPRHIQLGEFTCLKSSEDGLRKPNQTVSSDDCLSPVSVKKVLSELSSCFPGVPIKRLYKQYKNKEGKKEQEQPHGTSKEEKNDTNTNNGKDSSNKPKKREQKERTKRKISIESEDELLVKQQKKVQRTNENKETKKTEKSLKIEKKNDSSKCSRKKRGREEEEEVSNEQNAKRKSSRIQNRSENDKNNKDKGIESSKRKKRKTVEEDINPKQLVEKEEKPEDSRSSVDEKRNTDKRDMLWTEKYQPDCSSEVMGNASSVSRLRSWLEAWKIKREKTLRKELEMQKRLLAKQKNKDSSDKKLSWWEDDQDSDFHLSDEESDDSCDEESGMCNTMLVVGPRGAGKTAAVYACAKELGYKVFEVNCSSKRSSKQILSRLEEATQSHLVITNPSASTPRASAFGGLFGSLLEKPAMQSPMSNFFKKSNESNEEKDAKNQSNKKKSQEKNEKGKERKSKGKEKEEKGRNPVPMAGGIRDGDSNSMPGLSLKAASLILFEEVDVVFEDDKGFWAAVTSFMRNAKCPIIMTSNDSRVDCDGRYEQLMIRSPSVNLLSAHLLVAALVNDIMVNPVELKTLATWYQCDIRKCLLALQLWVLSGGGVKITWEEFLKFQKDQKGLPDAQGSLEKVQNLTKAEESNERMVEQSLRLDDPGEESLFLSIDDWKSLARRPTRATRRGEQGSASASDFQNDDSDFEPNKPSNQLLTDENTHTDSLLDVNEPADSQSMQLLPDNENKNVSMPDVHCLLVEHVLGLANSVCGGVNGAMDVLKDAGISSDKKLSKDYQFNTRCKLIYNTQKTGINLVSNNLPTLLPRLHTSCSSTPSPVIMATKETADSNDANSMFSDKSLFDDGTSETPKKITELKSKEPDFKHSNLDVVAMTTDEKNDGSITVEHKDSKKKKDAAKEFNSKSFELFSSLAEDASFLDAYIPCLARDEQSIHTAVFGWWRGRVRAGLSDDVITITKRHDWSTCNTSTHIRGALEVASLENSYTHYKPLIEKHKYNGDVDNGDYLPYQEEKSVVNLTGLNDTQSSKLSSRNKLYKSVSSSLPLVSHCTHRVVSVDYLPTLRSICHTERLREQANTKRRFLHYLDSNSLCMSKTSQQSMADAFLAPN